jgi:uncharacterized RDD family membrane protein YckC
MTRTALHDAYERRRHSAEALAWHVENAEWRSLATIAHASGTAAERALREAQPQQQPPPLQQEQARLAATLARAAEAEAQQARAKEKRERRETRAKAKAQAVGPRERDRAAAPAPTPASATPAAPAASTAAQVMPIALRRFFARVLDTLTLGLLGAAAAWGVARWAAIRFGFGEVPEPPLLALLLLAPLALLPLEVLALTLAGTTPGKALLGLSVRRADGSRAGPFALAGRTGGAFARGLAFGLLPITLFTVIAAGATLLNRGATSWDQRSGTRVAAGPLAPGRIQAAAIALVALWFALTSGWAQQLLREIALRVYVAMFGVAA